MKKLQHTLALVGVVGFLLAGCGQPGPLYLPKPPDTQASSPSNSS
ncbi:LPS translocon maturation chaperone LptM [Rhodoferax aquaticus]